MKQNQITAKGVFQSLENTLKKFPIIGKSAGIISNHWKNKKTVFQSLEKAFLVLLAGCMLFGVSKADAESVRGDFNGWGTNWLAADTAFGGIWAVTFSNSTTYAPASFKFDQDGDWDPQWGSGDGSLNVSVNTGIGQVHNGGIGSGNMSVGLTENRFVTFRLNGAADWTDRQFVVMETDREPVSIRSVSDNHLTAGTNDITVSIELSAEASSQEKLYVRWSNNGFVSSSLAEASGSDTQYTATIPGTAPHTMVSYYVLSSTLYGGTVDSNPDLCTLRGANRNGSNYIYSVTDSSEPGFLWHASNVVSMGTSAAQFWIKIGYAQGTGTNRWTDHCVLYYTTNGTEPAIAGHGISSNVATRTVPLQFDHMEEDTYEGGDAMWWQGIATNLPNNDGSLVRYKIGAWNSSGNNIERFAEYNTQEGESNQVFTYSLYAPGADGLQVNGQNADYTTTKFFINEIAGDTAQIVVHYRPADAPNVKNVEVYSNLGRRDFVDVDYTNAYISADGYADGICPPDGNLISTNDTGAYFTAFPMAGGPSDYYWTGTVDRCGAYRLTARYQTADESNPTNWHWYSSDGLLDHAIVLSPTKTHEMTLYELNALTINATQADENGRSTFSSLTNAENGQFNLEWLNRIQANCLWFQPIHPSADTKRGDLSEATPGSPYATRDYFAVAKWFGDETTEADAMNEFTNFVMACDSYTGSVGTINIMLDGVFNHTAWDARMGQGGVDLELCSSPTNSMGSTKPGWYSLWTDYGAPATYYDSVYSNDIATAPDRGDFGKWDDVAELFFGTYSALVRHNPDDNANYKNEGDIYDFSGMASDTKALWNYFGYYADFWLKKTGHAGTNSWVQSLDDKGLDGLRCDFGQGLPPQFWEYFINHTRRLKWNFVFMAETLDGGIPGYRSNRHFDILNEDMVFRFTQAHISSTWEFKDAYEQRRTAYNGGSILLNLTGHDEVMPEVDPWMTASRYGCNAMNDGLPMIFYGQEKGIIPADSTSGGRNQGFEKYELNFGKFIVNFKEWNKATFWTNAPINSDGLDQWYGRVNWARLNSPALQSMNRYFLSRLAGGDNDRILAEAKYETQGAGPAAADVVLAFALILDSDHTAASDVFDLQGPWEALGLNTGSWYQVRNLASSDAFAYLWPEPLSGQHLFSNGIFVSLAADSTNQPITADGALVQYLKLVEVPAPHTLIATSDENGSISPSGSILVHDGFSQPFEISANPLYRIADLSTNEHSLNTSFDNDDTAYTFTWTNVQADGTISASFTPVLTTNNPAAVPAVWLNTFYPETNDFDAAALSDTDADDLSAWQEYIAGTNPTNSGSTFKSIVDNTSASPAGNIIRWVGSADTGRTYSIFWTDDLRTPLNTLTTNLPSAYPEMNCYTDTLHSAHQCIYYRIKVTRD